MSWLLTLIIVLNGQSVSRPVGLMVSGEACHLAGASMARAMALGTPGTRVSWRCDPPPPGVLS